MTTFILAVNSAGLKAGDRGPVGSVNIPHRYALYINQGHIQGRGQRGQLPPRLEGAIASPKILKEEKKAKKKLKKG